MSESGEREVWRRGERAALSHIIGHTLLLLPLFARSLFLSPLPPLFLFPLLLLPSSFSPLFSSPPHPASLISAADLDHDGSLTADEIMPFMPASTTELERPKWLAIADRHGAHDVLTIADLPALLRMAQKDERQTIATASITMAIFICYIRTSKSIMAMFSTESINGVAYLKVLYLPLLTSRRAYVRTRLYLLTYVLTYLLT